MKLLGFALALAALPLAAAAAGAPERSPFAYDPKAPLAALTRPAKGTKLMRSEHVSFRTFDGARVPGLLAFPNGQRPPYPCVIAQGGLNFRKEEARGFWQLFGGLKYGTLSIEPRFHGSRRTRSVDGNKAAADPRLLEAMLRKSVIDLRRAVDYLQTRRECAPDRIGYVGLSFGSFLGSLLAGADRRVKAPVLVVSGADWRSFFDGSDALLPGIEHDAAKYARALALLRPIDPKYWVGRISPRPVLMINGRRDEAIPVASALALHAAVKNPKRVVWYDGDHVSAFAGAEGRRVFDVYLNWFASRLGGRRTPQASADKPASAAKRPEIVLAPAVGSRDYLRLYRAPSAWAATRRHVTRIGYSELQGVGAGSGFPNCRGRGATATHAHCNGNDYETLTEPRTDMFGKIRRWRKKVSIGLWPMYPGSVNCRYSSDRSVAYAKALIRNALRGGVRQEDIAVDLDHAYDYSLGETECATYGSMRDAMASLVVSIKERYPRVRVRLSEGYIAGHSGQPRTTVKGFLSVKRYRTQLCQHPYPHPVPVYEPPLDDPCATPTDGRRPVLLRTERVPGLLGYHADLRRRIEELKRRRGIKSGWSVDGIILDADWGTLRDVKTLNPARDLQVVRDWNSIVDYCHRNGMSAGLYLVSIHAPKSLIDASAGRNTRRVWMLHYTDRDFYETTLNKINWVNRAQRLPHAERLRHFDFYYFTSWATPRSSLKTPVTISVPSNVTTARTPYSLTRLVLNAAGKLR